MAIAERDFRLTLDRMRKSLIEHSPDLEAVWLNQILDDIDDCLDDLDAPKTDADRCALIQKGLRG
jgi:hypothetical protein